MLRMKPLLEEQARRMPQIPLQEVIAATKCKTRDAVAFPALRGERVRLRGLFADHGSWGGHSRAACPVAALPKLVYSHRSLSSTRVGTRVGKHLDRVPGANGDVWDTCS
jgi:hypothetical protein